MPNSEPQSPTADDESIFESYILDVRIVEYRESNTGRSRYRFEAPMHEEVTFDDPEIARLYADVYFDVNGFVEAGTGDRGVPPEIVQAGKDTLAAYLITQPTADVDWVASFYGVRPEKIEKYASWVRERAAEIRRKAAEHDGR